jgi:hypothetical protein
MDSYASWHDARTQFVHLDFGSNSVRALHYSLDMVEIRHAGSANLLVPRVRIFLWLYFRTIHSHIHVAVTAALL